MPDLKQGDKVLYVPHNDHWLDTDRRGNALFKFVHVRSETHGDRFASQPVQDLKQLGIPHSRNAAGHVLTVGGHAYHHDGPLYFWPATVLAVESDGRVSLEIPHPHGNTLYYTVPYDPAKKPHTCHCEE